MLIFLVGAELTCMVVWLLLKRRDKSIKSISAPAKADPAVKLHSPPEYPPAAKLYGPPEYPSTMQGYDHSAVQNTTAVSDNTPDLPSTVVAAQLASEIIAPTIPPEVIVEQPIAVEQQSDGF